MKFTYLLISVVYAALLHKYLAQTTFYSEVPEPGMGNIALLINFCYLPERSDKFCDLSLLHWPLFRAV
jgi:hypothetical protein